ncbi:MAG: peptide chain release factor N(5)-glutamine methyltransferase [Burkholderiales bacterium]
MSLFTLGARLSADARRLAATIKIPREDAIREIRRLAAFALRLTPAQLVVRERESPGRFDLSPYGIVFDRRLKGEPMAYILGECGFLDHVFKVTPDVLIPRPETEMLVGSALDVLAPLETAEVLDLGTGSGCIGISVALALPGATVLATDFSAAALAVARENASRVGAMNVSFVESSWYDAIGEARFDLVVSNPPYIAEQDGHLEALRFEPQSALAAGADGLSALRIVVTQAPKYLKPGGALIVEHGYDQRDAVSDLFASAGFVDVRVLDDLASRPRMAVGFIGRGVGGKPKRRRATVNA